MSDLHATVPVIETENLILRAPDLGDLDAMIAFYASPRAGFVGGPAGPDWVWNKLCGVIGHWVVRGYGMWTIEDRASGAIAGRVGMIRHLRWPEPELGWQIYEGFEGRGIAYEAVVAARATAARYFGLTAPISLIAKENARSIRLAERLGATIESEGEVAGHPCLIWRHPVTEVRP
ncbi:MAG: GNAT family N-acetyltransferase [Paracoccus sp. (in: a-proteobacteria)]|nr:GNAT family N-acetyltransferase [Paracoccus sp. (in: a-proteobacteria)]